MSKTKSFYWDAIEQGTNYKRETGVTLVSPKTASEGSKSTNQYQGISEVKKRLIERYKASKHYVG